MAKVPDTKENEEKCLCPKCPTFDATSCPREKNENLFCTRGKSICPLQKEGCLCGACPVHEEYALENGYFCFHGAAE